MPNAYIVKEIWFPLITAFPLLWPHKKKLKNANNNGAEKSRFISHTHTSCIHFKLLAKTFIHHNATTKSSRVLDKKVSWNRRDLGLNNVPKGRLLFDLQQSDRT